MTKANWQKKAVRRLPIILAHLVICFSVRQKPLKVRAAECLAMGGVGVKVVSAKESQSLNLKYRNLNYPTDVLSFSLSITAGPALSKKNQIPQELLRGYLGDLVICLPVLLTQAKVHGVRESQELDLLLLHGILHLLGLDHEKGRVHEKKMVELERRVLKKLGYVHGLGLIAHTKAVPSVPKKGKKVRPVVS